MISDVSAKPVYISSFFAGNMSPDGYRQLLEHVKATGVNVWVQDGSCVDKLTAEQRERYLQASADCQSSAPASGIVYELFVAGKGKTFTAKPKPDAEIASLLAKRSSCGKDTLYFSLRYLPVAHGILEYWVQDGSCVDKLTAEQRERYLQASADCQSSAPASGIVYELFVAGKGKTFTAKPKPDAEIASLLAKRSSCGKDTLYFSLRYLPVAHGILEY